MTRKKSGRSHGQNPQKHAPNATPRSSSPPINPKPQEVAHNIEQIHAQAQAEARQSGIPVVSPITITPPPEINPEEAWKKAQEAQRLYQELARKAEDEHKRAEAERLEFEQKHSQAELDRSLLQQHEEELHNDRIALDQQRRELNDLHERLLRRESDAESGFLARNAELLANAEAELTRLQTSIMTERTQAFTALQREMADRRKMEEERLQGERTEHEAERIGFFEERKQLREAQERLAVDQEMLREDRSALEARVEQILKSRYRDLLTDLQSTEELLRKADSDRARLQGLLNEREYVVNQFKGRTHEEILRTLETLEADNRQLKQQLAARPTEDEGVRLQLLEKEKYEWQQERSLLRRQVEEYRTRAAQNQIPVLEVEILRDQKTAYEASCKKLRSTLDELRSDLEREVQNGDKRAVFAALSAFDNDKESQKQSETENVPDLKTLALEIQKRMVTYPDDKNTKLYYDIADVRSFLAGLAMSRLILLQGVSGTGKTSLPLAFAKAIGGESQLIPVQAGWRDKHDLIGYYNAFEGKFQESEFLKALYRAQCPQYSNRPFFIVLDEMNLSFVEQYFADFISALEVQKEEDRLVELLSRDLPEIPRQLRRQQGIAIRIPANVWFVGTANHDETTKDFADKTYDRAHVMELPIRYNRFEPTDTLAQQPLYSNSSLARAFKKAREKYGQEIGRATTFLHVQLRTTLADKFRVGWGNRLQKQVEQYVPVVIAAGGTLSEAMDYLVALKLMRKIRNRYENRPQDIDDMYEHFLKVWGELGAKFDDKGKLGTMLQEEQRRLGREKAENQT